MSASTARRIGSGSEGHAATILANRGQVRRILRRLFRLAAVFPAIYAVVRPVALFIEGFSDLVTSSIALVASGRATDWPGGIRTRWKSPTFTAYRVSETSWPCQQPDEFSRIGVRSET